MDMQGKPIGPTHQGTKNTTDPAARNPVQERAGAVASDSLAAESYNAGGEFAKNRDGAPSAQPGSSSTYNTTDTSAASELPPAADGASRQAGGTTKYPEDVGEPPKFPGGHNANGYYGGPSGTAASKPSSSSTTTTTTGSGGTDTAGEQARPYDTAPSYTQQPPKGGPKGKDLTEGGFEGEAQNNAAEIGSDGDPGRVALQGQLNRNEVRAGAGARQDKVTGGGQYTELESETSA